MRRRASFQPKWRPRTVDRSTEGEERAGACHGRGAHGRSSGFPSRGDYFITKLQENVSVSPDGQSDRQVYIENT